tara:strand:- start:293 stop:487 length:195 start_codon:yes stop_codon:yes gene_type:complete
MDLGFGAVYDIFTKVCKLAIAHQCDQVVFEFNGGKFSVSRSSHWSEHVNTLLQTYPRKEEEIIL